MVTVALRRIDPARAGSLIDVLDERGVDVLPNTAGCYTARDAVTTAQLAREAFETDWVKLEVIGDERTLLPDAVELRRRRRAARRRRLHRAAVHDRRPDPRRAGWRTSAARRSCRSARRSAAGMGIRNPYNIALIREQTALPVVLDAGVGTASDAALAMELGCDARAVRQRDLARRTTRWRWRARSAPASRPAGSRGAPGGSRGACYAEASHAGRRAGRSS